MNGSWTNWKILPSPSEKNLPLPASKIQSNFVIQIFSQSSHIFFAEYTPIIFFLLLRLTWMKGRLQGKSMMNAHERDWNTIEIRTGPEEMKMLEDKKGL